MVAARLLLGSTIAFGLFVHQPLLAQAQGPQQFAPLVDVRNTFITEALQRLNSLGFHNVRVAQQLMPDMPEGVVLWQYPVPSPMQTAVPRWRTTDEIVLIVVRSFPVLPNLSEWRADHALTLLGLIGLTGTIDPAFDAAHSQVIGQSIAPGPVRPGETLSLNLAPLRPDTTIVHDTVVQTVTRPATGERAGVPPMVVMLISLAALGAGAMGTAAAIRFRRPPHIPGPPEPDSSSPPRPDETQPGPRKLGVAAFEPVIMDEVVWVIHGSAHTEGGAR